MKFVAKISFIILFSIQLLSCSNQNSEIEIDFALKGYQPEMVGVGIISGPAFEGHASVSPDGNEIYFAIYTNDHRYSTISFSKRKNGKWTTPVIAPFSGTYSDGSPALSPSGKFLYFSSRRPVIEGGETGDNNIWFIEKTEGLWTEPQLLSPKINSQFNEFSPSVDINNNLYFCSNRPGGFGDMDIYFSEFSNGEYKQAKNLGESVNTVYHEGNVGVAPDGQTLYLMIQHKPGDFGYDDIHVSKLINGRWENPVNLGKIINTNTYDFSPKVSPDGKYLYFASRINREYSLSPGSKYTYESFYESLNSPLNGFGNIFRIKIEALDF